MTVLTEDEVIRQGDRLEEFLKDESVIAAFDRLRNRYVDQFEKANGLEEHTAISAKMTVLKEFKQELEAQVASKQIAKAVKTRKKLFG